MGNGTVVFVSAVCAFVVTGFVISNFSDHEKDLRNTLESAGYADVNIDTAVFDGSDTASVSAGTCTFDVTFVDGDQYLVHVTDVNPRVSLKNATADHLRADQNVVPALVRELCFNGS